MAAAGVGFLMFECAWAGWMEGLAGEYSRVVRFGETDAGGVVYFAELLKFCHEAYEDSLDMAEIDLRAFFSRDGAIAVPITHAQADFYRPMFCGDRITIFLTTQLITPDSFEVSYRVLGLAEEGETMPEVARALTRHVCIGLENRRRSPLPADLMRWVESLLSEPLAPI